MTLILAADCAMGRINVALGGANGLEASVSLRSAGRRSEALPMIVDELLARAGRTLGDIGLAAVTIGPGYYTGIRVRVSYVCALAEALGIEVVPLPALRTLAAGADILPQTIVPNIRAREGAVYGAAYRGGDELIAPCFIATDELIGRAAALSRESGMVLLCEDDARAEMFRRDGIAAISAHSMVCCNMIGMAAQNEATGPAALRAVYLRPPG